MEIRVNGVCAGNDVAGPVKLKIPAAIARICLFYKEPVAPFRHFQPFGLSFDFVAEQGEGMQLPALKLYLFVFIGYVALPVKACDIAAVFFIATPAFSEGHNVLYKVVPVKIGVFISNACHFYPPAFPAYFNLLLEHYLVFIHVAPYNADAILDDAAVGLGDSLQAQGRGVVFYFQI